MTTLHALARSQSNYQPWIDAFRRGDTLDPLDADGSTPLHHAILPAVGNCITPAPAFLLLALGAEPDVADHQGVRPMHLACAAHAIDLVRLLIALGAEVERKDAAGRSPRAMLEGREIVAGRHAAIAHTLETRPSLTKRGALPTLCARDVAHTVYRIRRGADVNHANSDGNTALHVCRSSALLAALLARGADPNARNARGETPLHVACRGIGYEVKLLLDNGADPTLEDAEGLTPIERLEAQDYTDDFYDGFRLEGYRNDLIELARRVAAR